MYESKNTKGLPEPLLSLFFLRLESVWPFSRKAQHDPVTNLWRQEPRARSVLILYHLQWGLRPPLSPSHFAKHLVSSQLSQFQSLCCVCAGGSRVHWAPVYTATCVQCRAKPSSRPWRSGLCAPPWKGEVQLDAAPGGSTFSWIHLCPQATWRNSRPTVYVASRFFDA